MKLEPLRYRAPHNVLNLMLEIFPDWNWWASELFWLTDGAELSVRTSWSHKPQPEPHHCGFTADSNSIDVYWGAKERAMIKVNHDVLCHTKLENLNTIRVQEKRQHINANRLGTRADAVSVMCCVEWETGRVMGRISPIWFPIDFFVSPSPVLSQSHGRKTTNIQDVSWLWLHVDKSQREKTMRPRGSCKTGWREH